MRCRRCGKKLTKPESIWRGYGDVCWEKVRFGLKKQRKLVEVLKDVREVQTKD